MDLDPLEVIDLRLLAYAYSRSMEYRADHYITGIEFSTKASQGEEVMRQLDSIQEDERLIYLLHVVDGYSVREIARAYGKSEDTTREMIGAALVSLDNVFGHDDPESVASGSSNGTFSQLL
ncbi:sigma factor-like helix-turn-helix DNA-binding protein [Bacteroidota bacterium]